MAKESNKSPHRLSHTEEQAGVVQLIGTFGKGDVVIRQGAPCMVVDVREGTNPVVTDLDKVWVCNLQTGSVWPVTRNEQVWPCTDVQLSLKSSRREG